MAQSETTSNGDGPDVENTAAALKAEFTAEELRRLAAHLPSVSRSRGATKAETAEEVAEQAEADLAELVGSGDFSVTCTCGLRLSCGHPQVARREAKRHKSENLTHFPKATDDETETSIYG